MQAWDDAALLRAVAKGDQEALLELYDRYHRLAFALAYRILADAAAAEEVVQDCFLRIWYHAGRFQPTRGSVRTWILTIVRNRALDELRRRQARPVTVPDDLIGFDSALVVDDAAIERIQAEAVRHALHALPSDQRTVIELAFFEGLTHREIAERLALPIGTVKSRLRLGLSKLADLLELASDERKASDV